MARRSGGCCASAACVIRGIPAADDPRDLAMGRRSSRALRPLANRSLRTNRRSPRRNLEGDRRGTPLREARARGRPVAGNSVGAAAGKAQPIDPGIPDRKPDHPLGGCVSWRTGRWPNRKSGPIPEARRDLAGGRKCFEAGPARPTGQLVPRPIARRAPRHQKRETSAAAQHPSDTRVGGCVS